MLHDKEISMLQGLLTFFYALAALLLILLVLVQRGKSNLGMSALSSNQMFGASGGQDFLQKITWGLGAFLMVGCLLLSMQQSKNLSRRLPAQPMNLPLQQELD